MAFRDDLEAQRRRSEALEAELDEERARNATLEAALQAERARGAQSGSGTPAGADDRSSAAPSTPARRPSREEIKADEARRARGFRWRRAAFVPVAVLFLLGAAAIGLEGGRGPLALYLGAGGIALVFALFEVVRGWLVKEWDDDWGILYATHFRVGRLISVIVVPVLSFYVSPPAGPALLLAGFIGGCIALSSFAMPEEMVW